MSPYRGFNIRRRRRRRMLALLAVAATALLASGLLLSGEVTYRMFIRADRTIELPGTSRLLSAERVAWRDAYHGGEWTVTTRDGLALVGDYYRPAETNSHLWFLVLHGESSGAAASLEDYLVTLHERGGHILAPDLRGYGRSGGEIYGWGIPDKADVSDWIRRIVKTDAEAKIVLVGFSQGAAAALLCAADAPGGVCGVIADSCYDTLERLFSIRLRAHHIPSIPFLWMGDIATQRRAGYAFSQGDCLAAARALTVPVLFIHGGADDRIPAEMSRNLYRAAPEPSASPSVSPTENSDPDARESARKKLLIVPGAGHGEARQQDPENYWASVDAFLERAALR